jgi:hypothetical protein
MDNTQLHHAVQQAIVFDGCQRSAVALDKLMIDTPCIDFNEVLRTAELEVAQAGDTNFVNFLLLCSDVFCSFNAGLHLGTIPSLRSNLFLTEQEKKDLMLKNFLWLAGYTGFMIGTHLGLRSYFKKYEDFYQNLCNVLLRVKCNKSCVVSNKDEARTLLFAIRGKLPATSSSAIDSLLAQL